MSFSSIQSRCTSGSGSPIPHALCIVLLFVLLYTDTLPLECIDGESLHKIFLTAMHEVPSLNTSLHSFVLCDSGAGLMSLKNSVFPFLYPKPLELNHDKGRYRDCKGTRDFLVISPFISFLKMLLYKISDVLAKSSVMLCQTILSP